MDCKTGALYRFDYEQRRMMEEEGKKLLPLSASEVQELEHLTPAKRKNNMRNKPCVCGSGKKFKRCCWSSYA